jgi:hypothetical protein
VKVYLLLADDRQSFFYSDESEIDESREEVVTRRSGLRGWLQSRWHKFEQAFHGADDGVALRARQTWDWLHSLAHPDETMLVRFRATRRIELHHPASRTEDAAKWIWQEYLARRWRRHLIFLSANAFIAPLALALLWPLPGPNLIGYWFAYRAVHHWLILRGIRKVRKGRVPTHYHSEASLDKPVQRDEEGKARHAAIEGEGHRLDEHLNWTSPSGASAGEANPSPPPSLKDSS